MYLFVTLSPLHLVTLSSLLALTNFHRALLTASAIGVACAVLSVIVVLRRWAFIGEGISHAGFGGIGTAWLCSLVFPALGNSGAAYGVAILFCIAMALSIGFISRERSGGERFGTDTAIGVFLVASVAWGFAALAIYQQHHPGPGGAGSIDLYLFGTIDVVSPKTMAAGVTVSAAVILLVAALFKEIIYYAFDPLMAQVSGVRIAWIHYLLMVLLALVIVIGMRIMGNLLMTALLVLPGATALSLSRKLNVVMVISIIAGLIGSAGGLLINHALWPMLPSGPAIVLVLFAMFVVAYASRSKGLSR